MRPLLGDKIPNNDRFWIQSAQKHAQIGTVIGKNVFKLFSQDFGEQEKNT